MFAHFAHYTTWSLLHSNCTAVLMLRLYKFYPSFLSGLKGKSFHTKYAPSHIFFLKKEAGDHAEERKTHKGTRSDIDSLIKTAFCVFVVKAVTHISHTFTTYIVLPHTHLLSQRIKAHSWNLHFWLWHLPRRVLDILIVFASGLNDYDHHHDQEHYQKRKMMIMIMLISSQLLLGLMLLLLVSDARHAARTLPNQFFKRIISHPILA